MIEEPHVDLAEFITQAMFISEETIEIEGYDYFHYP